MLIAALIKKNVLLVILCKCVYELKCIFVFNKSKNGLVACLLYTADPHQPDIKADSIFKT